MILVESKLLERQITNLLESNINESAKSGLHNLLGEIFDAIERNKIAVLFSADYPVSQEIMIEQIVNLMAHNSIVLQDFIDEYNRLKKERQ